MSSVWTMIVEAGLRVHDSLALNDPKGDRASTHSPELAKV